MVDRTMNDEGMEGVACDDIDKCRCYKSEAMDTVLKLDLFVYERFKNGGRYTGSNSSVSTFDQNGGEAHQVMVDGTVTRSGSLEGDTGACHIRNGFNKECMNEFKAGELTLPINIGPPSLLPEDHYLRDLKLTVMRNPYTHGCGDNCFSESAQYVFEQLDVVEIERWVPVTGISVAGEVPRTFTVPTRERLVFNVLHDPPGGSSWASWTEGSQMSTRITMANVHAVTKGVKTTLAFGGGMKVGLDTMIAPFGMGAAIKAIDVDNTIDYGLDPDDPQEDWTQSKSNGYDISFSLDKTISTSSDPGTAGRASDLILGGGLELQFTEVVQVLQNASVAQVCLMANQSLLWEPAKLTTFLLPIQKIADEMTRIKAEQKYMDESVEQSKFYTEAELAEQSEFLLKRLEDWEAILGNYERSRNETELQKLKDEKRDKFNTIAEKLDGLSGAAMEVCFKYLFILRCVPCLDRLNGAAMEVKGGSGWYYISILVY
jgi:hypothetical protein